MVDSSIEFQAKMFLETCMTAHHWPPKVQEGSVALLPELLVLLTLHAAHPFHHLLAQLHRRRQRLRVTAQDVAEVDVEELPCNQDRTCYWNLVQANVSQQRKGKQAQPDLSLWAAGCPSVCLLLLGCTWWHSTRLQTHTNRDISSPLSTFLQEGLLWSRKLTAALDVSVHHLWADTIGSFFTWCMLPKEAL